MPPAPDGSPLATRSARPLLLALALLLTLLLALTGLVPLAGPARATAPDTPPEPPVPVVSGNRLLDGRTGDPLRVAGVNRSGSEYACAQGWGLFDGPVSDESIRAITAWGTNTVRVPLNESCWLAVNAAPARWSGATYRTAITDLVTRLQAQGQAVILDLHWSAATTELAKKQAIAPGQHSTALWRSVATTFRDNPSVMFELFNEPRDISWTCWRDGCTTPEGWRATGMQQLVDTVRATGARQPIIVGGLNWAGDLSGWAAHAPRDPLASLVAGWHIYDFSQCSSTSCWDETAGELSEQVPVLLTEVGQTGCATDFVDRLLPWADRHGIGAVGWAWNTADCSAGPSLISDYDGTPTAFGEALRRHFARTATPPAPPVADPLPDPVPLPVTPPGPARAAAPGALFDFEGATQGWQPRWGGITAGAWSGPGHTGTGALALGIAPTSYAAAGVELSPAQQRSLAGAGLSLRVWAPRVAGGGAPVTVSPVVQDGSWRTSVSPAQQLEPGAWSAVTLRVPAGGVRVVGLQVDNPTSWSGTVYVDDVVVTTRPTSTPAPAPAPAPAPRTVALRSGFETSTDGWTSGPGRVQTWRRTTPRFAGNAALAVALRGKGRPVVTTSRTSGLTPGTRVTMRVHAPRRHAPAVRPLVVAHDSRTLGLRPQRLARGWNTVSFTVPASTGSVARVGLQVENARGWRGVLGLDHVVW